MGSAYRHLKNNRNSRTADCTCVNTHTQSQCIPRHYKRSGRLLLASVKAFCHFQVCSRSYGPNCWGLYGIQPFRVYTCQRGALTQEEGARQGPACLRDTRTKRSKIAGVARTRQGQAEQRKRTSILQSMRNYSEATMASEATEARELRLQRLTAIQRERLAAESAEERQARLQQLSSNQQQRLAGESAEERQARLQQLSSNQQQRLAAETAEERQARLQQLSSNQQERLARESAEERLARESAAERQARLQQLSSNQQERLARESQEARQARLVQLSDNQRERLAAESVGEREADYRLIARSIGSNVEGSLIYHCWNSLGFSKKCAPFTHTLLLCTYHSVLLAWRDFLASSFSLTLLSVCGVVGTSMCQNCTPPTIWILAQFQLNCRLFT